MATGEEIRDFLAVIREPKDDKKPFEYYLNEAWETFGLEGAPDLVSLEAFLIDSIIHVTVKKKYKPSADEYRTATQKRDAYLLALGLLDGYYHTKEDGTYYAVVERQKQYLYDSDYIKLSRYLFKPGDNLDINDSKSKPRQNITQDDTRCRKYLGKYLSNIKRCRACQKTGMENFTYEIKNDNGSIERKIKLPKPEYTLENFPLAVVEPELDQLEISKSLEEDSVASLPKEISPSPLPPLDRNIDNEPPHEPIHEGERNGVEGKATSSDDKDADPSGSISSTGSEDGDSPQLVKTGVRNRIILIISFTVVIPIAVYFFIIKAFIDKYDIKVDLKINFQLKIENMDVNDDLAENGSITCIDPESGEKITLPIEDNEVEGSVDIDDED